MSHVVPILCLIIFVLFVEIELKRKLEEIEEEFNNLKKHIKNNKNAIDENKSNIQYNVENINKLNNGEHLQ